MKLWTEAPLSLRAYVVVVCCWSLVAIVLQPHPIVMAGIALALVISYLLLRGMRWLWLLMIALSALFLLAEPFFGGFVWYLAALGLVELVLLLLPDTRRHFAPAPTAPSPPARPPSALAS